jgi:hypothetical protein
MDRFNRKTIFCDIDGTILYHQSDLHEIIHCEPKILDGVLEKLLEWRDKDYYIVLTTARPEGCRFSTEKQLNEIGIFYDQLIMGLTIGPRVVINDKKKDGPITSYAICVERNSGLSDIEI